MISILIIFETKVKIEVPIIEEIPVPSVYATIPVKVVPGPAFMINNGCFHNLIIFYSKSESTTLFINGYRIEKLIFRIPILILPTTAHIVTIPYFTHGRMLFKLIIFYPESYSTILYIRI